MANKEYIERLQMVIKHLHGCDSKHVTGVPVHEKFNGKTVWDGEVEVFRTTDHPTARLIYAWSFKDDAGQEHMMAVLGVPPVKSAADAVRVSIVADAKKKAK